MWMDSLLLLTSTATYIHNMLNEKSFLHFNHSDDYIMSLDTFRHLAYFNVTPDGETLVKRPRMVSSNIVVFSPYYHRFKKLRRCNIGFKICRKNLEVMISLIEKHLDKKSFHKTYAYNRIRANMEAFHLRDNVFQLHGKICLCCASTDDITIDHVKPVVKGGLFGISNLQPLCRSCNSSKGTKTVDYR